MGTGSKSEAVAEQIARAIRDGVYAGRLPSERELAQRYVTSPVTAAKALNALRERGVVSRVAGVGTFVEPERRRTVVMHFGSFARSAPALTRSILAELSRLFPRLDFELTSGHASSAAAVEHGADLVVLSSTCTRPYSEWFRPLPAAMVQRLLDSGTYENGCLAIHRDHRLHYGLTFLFSPVVWLCNLDLIDRFRTPRGVYDFTFADIDELCDRVAARNNMVLFDKGFMGANLMNLIYAHIPDRSGHARVPWKCIDAALARFAAWYRKTVAGEASFRNGNVLFTGICRQSLALDGFTDFPFRWDVLPVPDRGGRVASIASLNLFVSNRSAAPEELFEVCEAFVAPAIQKLIAESRHGIPVHRAVQCASLNGSRYRDDVFFSQIRSMIAPNRFFEMEFVVAVYAMLRELDGTVAGFTRLVRDIKSMHSFYEARRRQMDSAVELDDAPVWNPPDPEPAPGSAAVSLRALQGNSVQRRNRR